MFIFESRMQISVTALKNIHLIHLQRMLFISFNYHQAQVIVAYPCLPTRYTTHHNHYT